MIGMPPRCGRNDGHLYFLNIVLFFVATFFSDKRCALFICAANEKIHLLRFFMRDGIVLYRLCRMVENLIDTHGGARERTLT